MNRFIPLYIFIFLMSGCSLFEEKTDEELVSEIIKEIREKPSATGVIPDHPHKVSHGITISAEKRSQAEDLTLQLVKQINAFKKASDQAGLSDLIALAQQRRELLLEMIGNSPIDVLRTALPDQLQANLPPELLELLEHTAEIEGELTIIHEDYEDPSQNRFRHFLRADGQHFSLNFAGDHPSKLKTGNRIRVNGLLLEEVQEGELEDSDGIMALVGGENIEVLAAGGEESSESASSATQELSGTIGEQRTLVILINFQDKPSEKPWTTAFVHDNIFGDTNDFYIEASYGQTWLSGDVFGWYTIPMDSSNCNIWSMASYANAEVDADPTVDRSSYDRYVYIFPRNSCTWGGQGTIGGNPSYAWINGTPSLYLVGHELGHGFGLRHAKGLECGETSIGEGCFRANYADSLDIMGSPNAAHFNAFHKTRLGWLGFNNSPPITTVQNDGVYSITPYELNNNDTKALKILHNIDASTGNRSWYYLEYRQPIGVDDFVAEYSNIVNGVVIHKGTDNDGDTSDLLDMTPNSQYFDWDDPALVMGDSFYDPTTGLIISTESTNSNAASVSISFGPQTCVQVNPMLAISPAESVWLEPGIPFTYSVTLTNNDSNCAASTYDLSVSFPSAWTASFADPSLVLDSGVSSSTTLTVTSPDTTTDGFYDIVVNTENFGSPEYSQTGTVTYIVNNIPTPPPNQAPTATDDTIETNQDISVTILVLSNDTDPDGDSISVTAVDQGNNGTTVVNAGDSVIYTPDPGFSGIDNFIYSITDNQGGTPSANVTVTVTANAINHPPVAANDNSSTTKDRSIVIPVLTNDIDIDGDNLTIVSATQGAKGSVIINEDGSGLTYIPGKQFKNGDSFTYTITDGIETASAVVSVSAQTSTGGSGKGGGKKNR